MLHPQHGPARPSHALAALALAATLGLAPAASAQGTSRSLRPDQAAATLTTMERDCHSIFHSHCELSVSQRALVRGALAGDLNAQLELARLLQWGFPIRDDLAAAEWYGRAAEQGNPLAAARVLEARRAERRIEINDAQVAALLRPQAERGDAMAMRALGEMALLGRGMDRDPDLGMRLLRQGAEQGRIEEKLALAQLLELGAPNLRSPAAATSRAVDLLVRRGPPEALEADRVALREAVAWRIRAARLGDVGSLYTVGMTLANNTLIRDPAAGLPWIVRAAMAGEPRAMVTLIGMYRERGNPEEAYYWLEVATAQGASGAGSARPDLEMRLSDAQRRAAIARAAAWRPLNPQEAADFPVN